MSPKLDTLNLKLAYASLWSLVLFSFVSLSASALSHILMAFPAIYFTLKAYRERQLKMSASMVSLIFVIFFAIISIIAAPDIGNKLKQISKLKYFLIGLLSVYPLRSLLLELKERQVSKMMTIFLVLLCIGNIAGIYALYTQYHPLRMKAASDGHRAAGMYGMAITYGYGVELVLILMVSTLFYLKEKISKIINPWVFYLSLLSTIVGFYLSFTRGAMVAFICSLPFLFLKTNKKLFLALTSALAILFAVITLVIWNGTDHGNRFLLKAKTKSNMIRLSQYEAVAYAFKEKPITGWGYRNFEPNVEYLKKKYDIDHKDFLGHAHNNYLEFLAGTGIFGFISFCCFVFFWLKETLERSDILGYLFFPVLISFSVSGLFQNTITDGENMFVIMFFYSLLTASRNITLPRLDTNQWFS